MTNLEIDDFMLRIHVATRDVRQCHSRPVGLPGGATGARCDRRNEQRLGLRNHKQRNLCTGDEY